MHKDCAEKQYFRNGSKKCTESEAKALNELQHAIGSHHGIHRVTYSQARESLDEMLKMVKPQGGKDRFFK